METRIVNADKATVYRFVNGVFKKSVGSFPRGENLTGSVSGDAFVLSGYAFDDAPPYAVKLADTKPLPTEPTPEPDPDAPTEIFLAAGSVLRMEKDDGSLLGSYRVVDKTRLEKV